MGTPLPQKAAEAVNTAANPTFATKSAKCGREQMQQTLDNGIGHNRP